MTHYYYGNGKGKTTAALGMAVRAAGHGLPVCVVQFLKGSFSGEVKSLEVLPQVTLIRLPKDYGFSFQMTQQQMQEITAQHNHMLESAATWAKQHPDGLLILDEIGDAVELKLIDVDLVKQLVMHPMAEQIYTGHAEQPLFTEHADYVTECRCVRHPHQSGVQARKGIEY